MEVKNIPAKHSKKPDWIRVKLPTGKKYTKLRGLVDKYKLKTICTSGSCPNMGECWAEGTATFMILGNVCTRSCSFCAVATGRPGEYDLDAPQRIAEAVTLMGVKHSVITRMNSYEVKYTGTAFLANDKKIVKKRKASSQL